MKWEQIIESVVSLSNDCQGKPMLLVKVRKINGENPKRDKKSCGTFENTQALVFTHKQILLWNDQFPQYMPKNGKSYVSKNHIQYSDIEKFSKFRVKTTDNDFEISDVVFIEDGNVEEKIVTNFVNIQELQKLLNEKTEEKKTMEKMNETVVAPATINEVADAPVIPTTEYVNTDSVAPSMVATASEPITSVADFLAMVHSSKTTGIADGRIKLSLDEVMERLGGTITVQKIEQCANEGRNFFVVQLSEQTYMYSFKMLTTIIAKWVQACGGVDGLNKMLEQTEIKMKLSKSEYMGKTYTRCDVI